jgi:phosphate:Na+ symporter
LAPGILKRQPELLLVGFYSLFNLLGVILVLPVAGGFARFIIWLVPDKRGRLARTLDSRALAQPMPALELAHAALKKTVQRA